MFKTWIDAIRKGNEYRLNKYGPTETIAESYARARQHVAWERENIKPKINPNKGSREWCKQQDEFKSRFAFWDEWTSARYDRVENPDQSKVKDRFSVCRSNAVTGEWEEQ